MPLFVGFNPLSAGHEGENVGCADLAANGNNANGVSNGKDGRSVTVTGSEKLKQQAESAERALKQNWKREFDKVRLGLVWDV